MICCFAVALQLCEKFSAQNRQQVSRFNSDTDIFLLSVSCSTYFSINRLDMCDEESKLGVWTGSGNGLKHKKCSKSTH